jgi:hypothetical protein
MKVYLQESVHMVHDIFVSEFRFASLFIDR